MGLLPSFRADLESLENSLKESQLLSPGDGIAGMLSWSAPLLVNGKKSINKPLVSFQRTQI
jgi:hypothetical protein